MITVQQDDRINDWNGNKGAVRQIVFQFLLIRLFVGGQ